MTAKERLDLTLSFMKLPGGTPILTVNATDWLWNSGFFTAPASASHHGNYEGGLFDHSIAVAQALVHLTENLNLDWKNPRSPYLVGMFHDLCKIDQYRHPLADVEFRMCGCETTRPVDTTRWEYNPDTTLSGHGDKSVMLLSQFYRLTDEEIMCIRYHMGAFTDQKEWAYYTRAVQHYPNVLYTHTADMLASQVSGV